MTALENVLVGMHSQMHASPVDAFFNTRRASREEVASDKRAQELLALVGLRGIGNELARNLPYGDQRRLEIARALASGPQAAAARRAGGRDEPQGDARPHAAHLPPSQGPRASPSC